MAKKKDSVPPKETHICYLCGKVISGDHDHVKTKRGSNLHICFECSRGEKRDEGK